MSCNCKPATTFGENRIEGVQEMLSKLHDMVFC